MGTGGRCKVQENPIGLLPTTLVAEPDHLKNRCLEVFKLQEELGAQHPCPLDLHRPQAMGPEGFAESEDYKEYRRWKLWLSNKFKTLDKLQADARGPYLLTCLSGKALETVEHVDPAEYQTDGGEQVLLRLLDARFPEHDQTD